MRMQKYHQIMWVQCDTTAKQTVISDPCKSMDRQVKDGVSIPKREISYKGLWEYAVSQTLYVKVSKSFEFDMIYMIMNHYWF